MDEDYRLVPSTLAENAVFRGRERFVPSRVRFKITDCIICPLTALRRYRQLSETTRRESF